VSGEFGVRRHVAALGSGDMSPRRRRGHVPALQIAGRVLVGSQSGAFSVIPLGSMPGGFLPGVLAHATPMSWGCFKHLLKILVFVFVFVFVPLFDAFLGTKTRARTKTMIREIRARVS